MKRRALISVTDKTGVVEFARGLVALGFDVLSTGGTARALTAAGIRVQEVADYTGFPETMDGRVKTLHPRVHGGLLGVRANVEHRAAMTTHGIDPIDVLAVNLYAFRQTARKPGVARDEVVENIDIGGPAMIRSAAKNHADVAVVVEPADYERVLAALRDGGGKLSTDLLRELAGKAFRHTAEYDLAIASWFAGDAVGGTWFHATGERRQALRYGENPHQQAAFYRANDVEGPNLATATQRLGKELSYNNILDSDAALRLAHEFTEPCCVIVKHANPCGVATAPAQERAFLEALACDPVSAFGGILAVNRPLTVATAAAMVEHGTFVEVIVCPAVEPDALTTLQQARWGANVRVLDLGGWPANGAATELRQVTGGFLVQTQDVPKPLPEFRPATARTPGDAERRALGFAWLVCKHVKSNAIVLAKEVEPTVLATVGIGAGQTSRVDSVRIAAHRAGERATGSVLASDAFFPFADGLEAGIAAGITAVVQPGGSKRDAEVVAAAERAGLAMVMTGVRHFRH